MEVTKKCNLKRSTETHKNIYKSKIVLHTNQLALLLSYEAVTAHDATLLSWDHFMKRKWYDDACKLTIFDSSPIIGGGGGGIPAAMLISSVSESKISQ